MSLFGILGVKNKLFKTTFVIPAAGKTLVNNQYIELAVYDYVQSKSFRGFKAYPIVVYGDAESEKNNELLSSVDMAGKHILFKLVKTQNHPEPFLLVYIEDVKIGAVFDQNEIYAMSNSHIESVFCKFEAEKVIGNREIITRHRARLFVKIIE